MAEPQVEEAPGAPAATGEPSAAPAAAGDSGAPEASAAAGEAAVGKKKRKRRRFEDEAKEMADDLADLGSEKEGEKRRLNLPPAKSIFEVRVPKLKDGDRPASGTARVGELLGVPTPTFALLTSRGMPMHLRPQTLCEQLPGRQLFQMPLGDVLLRQEAVSGCPGAQDVGCRAFWPYLEGHYSYCSFRNPRLKLSVHGGDALCSVETSGGRRKVGPRELLDLQKVMRMDIVAAPGEEVPLDVTATRRLTRAIVRAGDWLKDILEAKAAEPELGFEWHVLASIQGGGNEKLRQKACKDLAAMPIAGVCIGGLGYDEILPSRARVLEACSSTLPSRLPRFLPLNVGTPIEVLQAVLLGVDVLEVGYPMQVASQGVAMTFSWDMPEGQDPTTGEAEAKALEPLLPQDKEREPVMPPQAVRHLQLLSPECREDFGPITEGSPVHQYSRAYLHHLLQVRELVGTMLLVQHNLHAYGSFFAAIRGHIEKGSLRRFAAWFLRTQTCDSLPEPPAQGAWRKKLAK